ncbi:SPOR domain-containing protein [Pandoraea terrigena]|uniref:SPOR domain-containing protein n=1 Tax=Pandoraea terrigena TaxID=2508292 RepID=A0A5E4RZC2_9BURK|nr:SPOR domain-containing protein [Pandoraea terrigena]VVD68637.1 SPOR domain-containing protein [Pandoraea terrigena]
MPTIPQGVREMLRALLLVMFLTANAALAAVQFGWLKWRDVLPATGREPARIEKQLEPERIRLTGAAISGQSPAAAASDTTPASGGVRDAQASRVEASPGVSGTSALSSSSAPSALALTTLAANQAAATATPNAVSGDAAASQAAATVASLCLDVGPFTASDAQQARGLLLAALPAGQGDIQSVALDKQYWVHLEPVPNKAAADKQVARLRAAGVTEYFLLNGDGSTLVVSLGLFNDEARAVRLMATAQKRGITPQLNERPNAKSRIVYRIAGINANAAAQIRGVVTQQWSARWVRSCPAPAGSAPG